MISIVYHFRDQPHMLLRHMMEWSALSHQADIELILIDDCSKVNCDFLARHANWPFKMRMARINSDMEWNYGCKNLGVYLATKPWVFLTNMDHMIPADMYPHLWRLVEEEADTQTYFRFKRNWANGPHIKYDDTVHLGTTLIRRDDWMALGGVDEDFNGFYGHDDTLLDAYLRHRGYNCTVPKGYELTCFADGVIGDADFKNNPEWSRDLTRNDALLKVKLQQLEDGVYRNTPPLNFDWELIK